MNFIERFLWLHGLFGREKCIIIYCINCMSEKIISKNLFENSFFITPAICSECGKTGELKFLFKRK